MPRHSTSRTRRAMPLAPMSGLAAVVAMAAGLAMHATPALAQDALGGGNALGKDLTMVQKHRQGGGTLDANTQVGANRLNTAAPKTDFYSRNLIVTGDVAGGRGFRGNVGYREQSEFTGQTGSDDNRRWDAYAALSTPSALRAGIDPFQATQQYGAVLYSRTYSNAAARDILTNDQPLDARLAFDRFTADGMRMRRQADIIDAANTRDSSARQNWRQEGKLPGAGTSSGSGAAGSAQPTGVPVDAMLSSMGLSTYERQRLKQDVLSGRTNRDWIGQMYNDRAQGSDASMADVQRMQPGLAREYTSLMDTMRARAGMTPRAPGTDGTLQPATPPKAAEPGTTTPDRVNPLDPKPPRPSDVLQPQMTPEQAAQARLEAKLEADLAWLRGELSQSGPDAPRGGVGPRRSGAKPNANGSPTGSRMAADGTIERAPQAAAAGTEPGAAPAVAQGAEGGAPSELAGKEVEKLPNLDEMAMVLKHGRRMESLVPEDAGYIRDMMQLGAQSMRDSDFFRAEERFGSVLRVIPGHPLALAGVANSQLGAGLSISAALSLRKLFAQHPEMIGARFGAEVLPDAERMEYGLTTARTRLRAAMAPDAGPHLSADRFDYGLLIAYIGYQEDKPEITEEGLSAMRACRADDPLLRVLQRVWLPEGAQPAPAVPANADPMPDPAVAPAPAGAPAPAQPAP